MSEGNLTSVDHYKIEQYLNHLIETKKYDEAVEYMKAWSVVYEYAVERINCPASACYPYQYP